MQCRIIKDTQAPVLTVDQPFDGMTVTTANLTISGAYHDISPVNITVNGNAMTLGTNTFSGTVTLVSGNNTLTVTGSDTVGNTRTITLHVTYTAVNLTITTPGAGALLKNPITVSGQITGMTPASLCVNDQYLIPAADGSFSATLDLADGPRR